MKRILFILLFVILFPTINVYGYQNSTYNINIPNTFIKSEEKDYWQYETDKMVSTILVIVEDNVDQVNLNNYDQENLLGDYVKELENKIKESNKNTEIKFSSIDLKTINNYRALTIDLVSSYQLNNEVASRIYQRQYIFSSKNYIYYLTLSTSDQENLDSDMFDSIIKSFNIIDEMPQNKKDGNNSFAIFLLISLCVIVVVIKLVLTTVKEKTEKN